MLGFLEVALSGLLFGSLPVLGKWVYAAGVSAGELLAFRFLGASGISFLLLAVWRRGRVGLPLQKIAVCALLGVCGYALFSSFFFKALESLSGSVTVLLLYQYPWMVALGGAVFLGERIPRSQLTFLPLMIAGLALVVGFDYEVRSISGLVFGLGAALFYSAYILIARRYLSGIDPYVGVAYIQLFAGLVLGALYLGDVERVQGVINDAGPLILFVIFVPTILAMSLFIAGLQKIAAWKVSVLSTLEPLTGMLLSMLLLGERFEIPQWTGAAVLLMCLIGIGWSQRRENQVV